MEVPYYPKLWQPQLRTSSCAKMAAFYSHLPTIFFTKSSVSPTLVLIIKPPLIDQNTCQSSDLGSIDETSPFNIYLHATQSCCSTTLKLFAARPWTALGPARVGSLRREWNKEYNGVQKHTLICCSYLKDSPMTSRRIRVRAGGCTTALLILVYHFKGTKTSVDAWHFGIELQWLPTNW